MIASMYAGLGEDDQALEWLETDLADGGQGLFYYGLINDPKFRDLKGNERFESLLDRVR